MRPLIAAAGVTEIVDETMAGAARVHAVENGKDTADRTLIAFGDALLSVKAPSAGTYGATGRSDQRAHRAVTLDGAL